MVKRNNFFYILFFILSCLYPINGQEVGTDEYLITKDTLIEDLYKRTRVKRSNVCICPEERDLTFTKSENSAFDNAVMIEEAANTRLHAWYDRQKTRIKEHLERRYNKSFANFDEAKNELFLNCERVNIKRNAIPIIRKYWDLKSHRFFVQNTYLKELKLLELRKIEIASGNFNSPKFGYLKVKGTRLKDIMDITTIDDLWKIRHNDFAKNNVITSRHHKTFKNLQTIESDQLFTNKIVDSKNHYFNHLSPYNQLNYIQFLMNNESLHTSRIIVGYPSKISNTFHQYQKGNIATSSFIEEYAVKKNEKEVYIFDDINKHPEFLGLWEGERGRQKFINLLNNRKNALKNLMSKINVVHLAIENLKTQLNITEDRQTKWLYAHQEDAQQIMEYLKIENPTISNAKERRRLFTKLAADREDFNNIFKDVEFFFKEKEERTHFVEDFLKITDEIENASFRHFLEVSHLVSINHQEINNDTFSESVGDWYGNGSSIALEEGKLKVRSIPLWSSVRKRLPQKVTAGNHIVGSIFVDLENTEALGIGVSKYNEDNYQGIDNIIDFTQGWNTFEYAVPEGVNTLDFKIFKNVNDGLETSYTIDNFKLSLNDISTDTENLSSLDNFFEIKLSFKIPGDPPYIKNNVHFIHFLEPSIRVIIRPSNQSFTAEALNTNTNRDDEYTINMQQYETKGFLAKAVYYAGGKINRTGLRTQGLTVVNGKILKGGRSSNSYYISQNKKGIWSSGLGDPPLDSKIGFGGGIPLIILGMPFGEKKKFDSKGNMIQNSSAGFPFQNSKVLGKTILAFNDKGSFMLVSQQDGVEGMTLDTIRVELISKGYTNAISFDGSTSATLVKDDKVIVKPTERKDNSIPLGAQIYEEN